MDKLSNILAQLKVRQEARKEDSGFSLLELVIAVGILLLLTVGGIVGYNGITANAQQAAVQSAASEVFTASVIAENDADASTTPGSVQTEYNNSADGITVAVTGTGSTLSVTATHTESGTVATKSAA